MAMARPRVDTETSLAEERRRSESKRGEARRGEERRGEERKGEAAVVWRRGGRTGGWALLTAQIVSGHSELPTRDYCFPFEVFPMFSSRRRDGNHLEPLSSLPTDI